MALTVERTTRKIAPWIEILSHYDFSIEYRPGNKQAHCDALSRCENPRECDCPEQDTTEPLKCGPCKKCLKRAQDMLHEGILKDIASYSTKSDDLKDNLNKKVKKEVARVTSQQREQEYQVRKGSEFSGPYGPELPGPSTSDRSEVSLIGGEESHNLTSTTVGIISADELRRYQNEDQDLAIMVQSKSVGVKPSRQDMVTKVQPVGITGSYGIHWCY